MIILSNEIGTFELVNNSIIANYSELVGKRTETILNNVPKSREARLKMLQSIEDRANKAPFNFEDSNSLICRYERQWIYLASLIYGWNTDFNKPNIKYSFADVLA